MANEVVGEVILKNVRLSFFDGFKPAKDKPDPDDPTKIIKGKFGANFLMDPKTPEGKANLAKLKAAGNDARKKKWGEDEKKWPKLKPEKLCVRDGSLEDYDGYEGMMYLSAKAELNRPPQIITNRKGKDGKWIPATEGSPGAPYSGCRVNAIVRLWAQDNTHGKRLNASVEVVQFREDGQAFGAAPVDPNEKFSDDDVGDVGEVGEEEDDTDDLV